MKLCIENFQVDKRDGLVVTPVSSILNANRSRPSSCCRISVRIPSVEPEEKKSKHLQRFPLRSSSVPKICEKPVINLTPSVSQAKLIDKHENTKNIKNSFIAYEKYLNLPIDSVLASQIHNMTPLPDPHIKEHKRAAMRLRKLKRITFKSEKENDI